MRGLLWELRKEKRSAISLVLPLAGVLGAVYGLLNFAIRKESLLKLPMPYMDILLTQLYGMILVLNLFALVTTCSMIYHLEYGGNAMEKMYVLPIQVEKIYLWKFVLVSVELFFAVGLEQLALAAVGQRVLPEGAFSWGVLLRFWGYAFVSAMPALSFMLMVAYMWKELWGSLAVGVLGFLTGMALANTHSSLFLLHPFVLMLKPAVAMSANPQREIVLAAVVETAVFFFAGMWWTRHKYTE